MLAFLRHVTELNLCAMFLFVFSVINYIGMKCDLQRLILTGSNCNIDISYNFDQQLVLPLYRKTEALYLV